MSDSDTVADIAAVLLREIKHPTIEDVRSSLQRVWQLFPNEKENEQDIIRRVMARFGATSHVAYP